LDWKCHTKYPRCWTKLHFVGLKIHFVGLNCSSSLGISPLLKENPIKMSGFLKHKYFFNKNSPSYNLIPEKDDFLRGKCPSFAWIFEK
jgi:hypothetical protein